MIKSLEWKGHYLRIIDQTKLPGELTYRDLKNIQEVYEAIQKLRVRGAPAIGVAAGFGLYIGISQLEPTIPDEEFLKKSRELADYLISSRPTAVNLQWAVDYIFEQISDNNLNNREKITRCLKLAQELLADDRQRCNRIGEYGSELIPDNARILTHCNTGALATAGIGTAFGVLLKAHQKGKKLEVFVDETRPLLQGARLTMWELQQAGIPATLISDNMAAFAMKKKHIDGVIVGADRIAANGDTANKIGTYNLAVLCQYHQIPFYVAAPLSTFDISLDNGEQIPIEERDGEEISNIWGKLLITTPNAQTWNPAFDVTPAELISAIITEKGILKPPFGESIKKVI
ncbi:MAG: S-methyl-5-thioribose-1-phosphate isomerase [Calditrichia bacterium]